MSTERMSDQRWEFLRLRVGAPTLRQATEILVEAERARSEEAKCDAALDEFASHHSREDGRPRTVSECAQEAMDTLRGRIASLEAERRRLRQAVKIEKARGAEYLKTIEQLRERVGELEGALREAHDFTLPGISRGPACAQWVAMRQQLLAVMPALRDSFYDQFT